MIQFGMQTLIENRTVEENIEALKKSVGWLKGEYLII
jgi:hypothetical protein